MTSPGLKELGGPFALLKKVLVISRATLASQFAYVGEQVVRTTFLVLILYIFTQLWNATDRFQDVREATGFSIPQLIWYLAFTESIIMSAAGIRGTSVDHDVRTGDLAYRLTKPIPYPCFQFGSDLGTRVFRFFLNLAVGIGVSLAVVGPIPLAPLAVLAAISLTLLVFVVDWIWVFSISVLSFWIEDTFGIHLLYRRLLMLLGGMLLPLEAYPDWLRSVCERLPFAYMVYHPSRLFVLDRPDGFLHAVGVVLLLGIVGLIPALLLYRLGLRQVSAQGG